MAKYIQSKRSDLAIIDTTGKSEQQWKKRSKKTATYR